MELLKQFETKKPTKAPVVKEEIKKPTPQEKLQEQIRKYKGSKMIWPESGKSRKKLRKKMRCNIDWDFFLQRYIRARDLRVKVRLKKETIEQVIINEHRNIRLWDDEQLNKWEAYYLEKIDKILLEPGTVRKDSIERIFKHEEMPKEYHYEHLLNTVEMVLKE
jgi:hypothetical protein